MLIATLSSWPRCSCAACCALYPMLRSLECKTSNANGVRNSTQAMYGPLSRWRRCCLYFSRKLAIFSSRLCPRKYASRMASSERGELNANDPGEVRRIASDSAMKERQEFGMGEPPNLQMATYLREFPVGQPIMAVLKSHFVQHPKPGGLAKNLGQHASAGSQAMKYMPRAPAGRRRTTISTAKSPAHSSDAPSSPPSAATPANSPSTRNTISPAGPHRQSASSADRASTLPLA